MKSPKTIQIVVVFGAVILTVLLYFANKKGKPVKKEIPKLEATAAIDLEIYSDSVIKSLDKNKQLLVIAMKQSNDQSKAYDSIASILLPNSVSSAAYYYQKSAQLKATNFAWKKAGMLYYKATRFDQPILKQTLFSKAIACYNEASKLDTNDLEAATMLGTCYVEGSTQPMDGIMLLRKVVSKDSTYVDAQVQLGMFAIQSGQMDKALDRFKKILKIKPDYIQAYIYLGQIYADMGKKEQAIEMLELYMKKSNDSTINQQVEQFINELKNTKK
jgi:tetratricopeptide (TPR) repeat protein